LNAGFPNHWIVYRQPHEIQRNLEFETNTL
jgi:hypothetical protein